MPPANPDVSLSFQKQLADGHIKVMIAAGVEKPEALFQGLKLASRTKRSDWASQDRACVVYLPEVLERDVLIEVYRKIAEATADELGGSTATTLLLTPEAVHVAWLGDSPAFLIGVNNKGAIQEVIGLNEPHVPLYEEARIQAAGGFVEYDRLAVKGVTDTGKKDQESLSMPRAFGNAWLVNPETGKSMLDRTPSFEMFALKNLSPELTWYAAVGSDGVIPEGEDTLLSPGVDAQGNLYPWESKKLITRIAEKFKAMMMQAQANNPQHLWAGDANWAECVVDISQQALREINASLSLEQKQKFGHAVIDDTTFLIAPIANLKTGSCLLTVADGHRAQGEITAQKTIKSFNQYCN